MGPGHHRKFLSVRKRNYDSYIQTTLHREMPIYSGRGLGIGFWRVLRFTLTLG
jgi:hypothetical protein